MKKVMIIAAVAAATSLANANEIADRLIAGTGPSKIETAVTNLVNFAFCENVGIKTFSGPNVAAVGNFAFRGCQKIETVELGAVEDMSKSVGVFSGCFSLTNVVLKSMSFSGRQKDSSFPWYAPNHDVKFVFKNGTFDRRGNRIK